MRKRIIYVIIIVVLLLTGCTIGGSFYMLNFSLTPDAKILSKDADSYPYMYRNYPFLRPWVDSLRQADARIARLFRSSLTELSSKAMSFSAS